MNKNKVKLSKYLKQHFVACFLYILTISLAAACYTLESVWFAKSISEVTIAEYDSSVRFLLFCIAAAVLRRGCWSIAAYIYNKYSAVIMRSISMDLTKRCFALSSSTFSENNSGTFLQRIMDDPNRVIDNLANVIDMIIDVISSLIIVIYIITLNWLIGLLYFAVLVTFSVYEVFRVKIRKRGRRRVKKINDKTYSLVGEIIKSERDIKALNLDDKLFDLTADQLDELKKVNVRTNNIDSMMQHIRGLFIDLFAVLILILGIRMVRLDLLTIATYILLFSYRRELYGFTWQLGRIVQCFTDISISTGRMFSLFNEEIFPIDKYGKETIEKPKGKIEFKNVKYSYIDVKEEDDEEKEKKRRKKNYVPERIKKDPIFKDLSFKIQPKTTVAFVGLSGSGKSTILSLIAKLIEAEEGQVLIDGVDIKDIDKECLRQNISLINQFPYIFDMTIKDNLLLVKKDATDDELWDALERASFADDVKAMPKGIDTKVGETGIKLSGGQRQRLAVARALLKESKIILFDESTSSLDNFAQSHIQQSIEKMGGQHTIVIVAHRLSTIKNVDKIFFLDKGQIVDIGTFEELFKNNAQFQALFTIENI